ncbi:hypothetical protein RUND412_010671 [Rhizina undulata]
MTTVDTSRTAVVPAPMATPRSVSQIPRPRRGSVGVRPRSEHSAKGTNGGKGSNSVGSSTAISPKESGVQPANVRSRSNSVGHSVRSETTSIISGRSGAFNKRESSRYGKAVDSAGENTATKNDRNVLAQRNSIRMVVKSDSDPDILDPIDILKEEQRKITPQQKRAKSNVSTVPKNVRMKSFPEETTEERTNRAKSPSPEISKIPVRKGPITSTSLNGRKTPSPETMFRSSIPTPAQTNPSGIHRVSRSYTAGELQALSRAIAAEKPDDLQEVVRPITPGANSFIPVRSPSGQETPRLRGGNGAGMTRRVTESDARRQLFTTAATISTPSSTRSRIPVATRSVSGAVNA